MMFLLLIDRQEGARSGYTCRLKWVQNDGRISIRESLSDIVIDSSNDKMGARSGARRFIRVVESLVTPPKPSSGSMSKKTHSNAFTDEGTLIDRMVW